MQYSISSHAIAFSKNDQVTRDDISSRYPFINAVPDYQSTRT